jgi:putative oxidoreductase
MPEGLLIIRLALGAFLFAHGTQKLFGWYGGYGLDGTGGFFESVGHRPGRQMAMVAGISEAAGAVLLVLGLLTPLGCAMIIGTMVVASMSVHAQNGPWATNGGYELPMTNALVAAGLAFTGAGGFSLDSAIGIPWTRGWGVGLLTVCVASLAAWVVLARRTKVMSESDAYPADTQPAVETAGDPGSADEERQVTA